MKRRATTSGKATKARQRPAKKSKRRVAPAAAAAHRKHSSDIDVQEQVRALTRELTEAREEQTATANVLKVISSSPGELEPVFQAMLENATRICEAKCGLLQLLEGDGFRAVAMHGVPQAYVESRGESVLRPPPNHPLDRLLRTKQIDHVTDVVNAPANVRGGLAEIAGARTILNVPMLKDDELIGVFSIYRGESRPFTDKQIELVQNFAAQAVIAIENTRLLNELRQRTDDLTESLEQQTATSEVLKVISSSPGTLGPVFDTMLENATRICEAKFGTLWRYDGELFHAVASVGNPPALVEFQRQLGAFRPESRRGNVTERVWRTKKVVHTADYAAEPNPGPPAKLGGARSTVAVPMLKDEELIGVITIYRQEVRPFTDKQIELVQNFAAQAVIAIENTRLLNELRQRTDDLTESLEQQTATSEVLKVISSSPGDLEPVFDAMLQNATQLCEANFGGLVLFENGLLHPVASLNYPAPLAEFVQQRGAFLPVSGTALDRAFKTKSIIHVADDAAEAAPTVVTRLGGARSYIAVPMLKDDELIGIILIYRQEVRPFTDKQIELVQNFAAQAVIAIENTRLLSELRESLDQQTATSEVLKVISRSTFDLRAVLNTLVESAGRLCRADRVNMRLVQEDGLYHHMASYGYTREHLDLMARELIKPGPGSVAGRTVTAKAPVHVLDTMADPEFAGRARTAGVRTTLGVPLLREGIPIGVLLLQRNVVQAFTDKQIELVTTFADQAVIAIENVRLFDEIQDKSRQLAEASQHKSQFLANMSHELRTPLNAILGYTELITDGIYGAPPEKMGAVLKRVESNGRHLLGLINAVLDLSKIEAGQFTLDLADYSLQNVAQTVYNAVESLAVDKKLVFKTEVQSNLPPGHGDERRLTQVLLNLVGNAIKFTDAGEVLIKADASDGAFKLAVRDTGPGISAADQAKLFQEFQQADNSMTRKKEGTGLGLAISKRIIEMHGGRIWVESQVGRGSTFFVMLPVQAQAQPAPPPH